MKIKLKMTHMKITNKHDNENNNKTESEIET